MADVHSARKYPGGVAGARPAPPRTVPNVRRADAASTASSIPVVNLPSPSSVPLSPVSSSIYGDAQRPLPPLALDEIGGHPQPVARTSSSAEVPLRKEGRNRSTRSSGVTERNGLHSGGSAPASHLSPRSLKQRVPHNRRPPTQAADVPPSTTTGNPLSDFVANGVALQVPQLSHVESLVAAANDDGKDGFDKLQVDVSRGVTTTSSMRQVEKRREVDEKDNLERRDSNSRPSSQYGGRQFLQADEHDRPSFELFQTESDIVAEVPFPTALMPQHSSWMAVDSVDSTVRADGDAENDLPQARRDGVRNVDENDDDDIQRTAAAMSQCLVNNNRNGKLGVGPPASSAGAQNVQASAQRRSCPVPPISTTCYASDGESREGAGLSPKMSLNEKPGASGPLRSSPQVWPLQPSSSAKSLGRKPTFADLVNEHRRRRISSALPQSLVVYASPDSAEFGLRTGFEGGAGGASAVASTASTNPSPSFAAVAGSTAYAKTRRQTAVALHLQPTRRPAEGRRSMTEPFADSPSLNGSLENTEYVVGERGSIPHAHLAAVAARRRSSSSSAARRPSMDTLRAMDLDALREEDAAEEVAELALASGEVFAPWAVVTPTAASLINAARPSMSLHGIRHVLSVQTTPTRELLPETDETALELMSNNMNVCTLEQRARRAQRGWVLFGVKLSRRLLLICCAVVLVVGGAVLGAVVATRKQKTS